MVGSGLTRFWHSKQQDAFTTRPIPATHDQQPIEVWTAQEQPARRPRAGWKEFSKARNDGSTSRSASQVLHSLARTTPPRAADTAPKRSSDRAPYQGLSQGIIGDHTVTVFSKPYFSSQQSDSCGSRAPNAPTARVAASDSIKAASRGASRPTTWWPRGRQSGRVSSSDGRHTADLSRHRRNRKIVETDRRNQFLGQEVCDACRRSGCQVDRSGAPSSDPDPDPDPGSWFSRALQRGQPIDAFGNVKLYADKGAAATPTAECTQTCANLDAAASLPQVALTRQRGSGSLRSALKFLTIPFRSLSQSRPTSECREELHGCKPGARRIGSSFRTRSRPSESIEPRVNRQIAHDDPLNERGGSTTRYAAGRGGDESSSCTRCCWDPGSRGVEERHVQIENCFSKCDPTEAVASSAAVHAIHDSRSSPDVAAAPAQWPQRTRAWAKLGVEKNPSLRPPLPVADASHRPEGASVSAYVDRFLASPTSNSSPANSRPYCPDSLTGTSPRYRRRTAAQTSYGVASASIRSTPSRPHDKHCAYSIHAPPFLGIHFAPSGASADPCFRSPTHSHRLEAARNQNVQTKDNTLVSSIDIYQPHPFGVWHRNQDGPTSLPLPPKRSASASFVRHASGPACTLIQPTRNAHSLGTLPDVSSANVSARLSNGTQRSSLGYADVRTSGFPFIMPESDSEISHTPAASQPASEVGSLSRFNAASDAGSAAMSRAYSDQPSMRSYEESSVSARGPGATINRKVGEQLGSTLREHFSPSPASRQSDLLSVVEHRDAPSNHAASASVGHGPALDSQGEEAAATRPISNVSLESASSPIMKMQPPSITTPSLRDFPVNANNNSSFESVHAPVRQRTDSRPTISPTNASRSISTPAPMPLPQALQDLRPTVRRAQGQRAESEVVRSRSSSKPFSFPTRSSAQYTSHDRANMLHAKAPQTKRGGSFIRRLIRRASLKGNKPPSIGETSHSVNSIARPSDLELENSSDAATTPRASKESRPRTSLTRRRSKSKDASSIKAPKASSIFAPFRARDPSKGSGLFRTSREDSFGHLGPLPLDDTPPFPRDGLPLASSSPFLARDPDFAGFSRASDDGIKSRDFAMVQRVQRSNQSSPERQEATELLDSPPTSRAGDLVAEQDGLAQRPLSHMTDRTDTSLGVGVAAAARNNFNFQDSLGLNELAAGAGHRSEAPDAQAFGSSVGHRQPSGSSAGHTNTAEGHARPRAGIPRIWQGLEAIDGDNTMRSIDIDDVEDSDDESPDSNLPSSRFDTVTTSSSFKTAASNLDSPRSASTRRHNEGSRASRVSLRTLDTPLARHFDQGTRQDSPLADLITNLEGRLSIPSTAGTMGSAPYQDLTAPHSSDYLPLEAQETRPALAAGPSPSPTFDGHGGQLFYDEGADDDDGEASIHALPRQTHLPAASHTALIETIGHSNRNSVADPTTLTSHEANDAMYGEQNWYKRDTFGGPDSIPRGATEAHQGDSAPSATRPQLSRFSTATAGPEDEDRPTDRLGGDETEQQEMVLPEVKVSEIESHLAAVEAALQDNRDEGSFDPTSLRQRMSDASYVMHANTSSASMLSPDVNRLSAPQSLDRQSSDDLPLPGAWTQDSSSFIMSDDGRRITLAPESHEALADAVRSVRRAISSSQLTDADESRTAIASRSVDTLGTESFMSEVAEPASETMPVGEASMLSEATPARAARKRQEGMRDIEEAYGRMLVLVQSSAIGVTPSPQIRAEEGRIGLEPPRRPMKHGAATAGGNEPFFNSPLAKASTKVDEPLSQLLQSKRNAAESASVGHQPARHQSRAQTTGENRTSTSLSGLMGIPLDINTQMLRHASISSASSALDASRTESVEGAPVRRRPPSDAKSSSSRYSQAFSRDHVASSLIESDSFRKRFSSDNTTVGRASSGGGHTSPSATAKTLGTPRSFATSVSQHSLANMVRRHELEKESLLDTLERVRAENADLHARHDSLTSDLHAEVTRVLELERELERRDSREVTLIGQIQELENELVELRYLDHQLNTSADQTLGSEDGEGSIMEVELPTTLQSSSRMGSGAFSPRFKAGQTVSPPQSFSSASVSGSAKPTHRSSRSEAFVSDLPGSQRSTLPASRSELPRARPISLLNGPGGLFREERGSERSSQASPLPTPRSSSLIRAHRASTRAAKVERTSPTLLGLSLPKEEDAMWNIADEQLPEIEDELLPTATSRSHRREESSSAQAETFDSKLGDAGHGDVSDERERAGEEDRSSSLTSANGGSGHHDASPSVPRSTSQVTVTKGTVPQLGRPLPTPSKIPTSRSVSGMSDSPSHRSVSSRLPRLGLKPSSRYSTTGTGTGAFRSISGATDKSTGSTLSSVYSTMSAGAPPSLGSLPSGNNTMEDEIQAELARLGNPKPYMRYYSPPRSKMI